MKTFIIQEKFVGYADITIEVIGEQVKVNKYGDKLFTLIDTLGWEYQRMGRSGRQVFDEIHQLLGTIKEGEVYMEI